MQKAIADTEFVPLTSSQGSGNKQERLIISETRYGNRVSQSECNLSVIDSLETIVLSVMKGYAMDSITRTAGGGSIQRDMVGPFLYERLGPLANMLHPSGDQKLKSFLGNTKKHLKKALGEIDFGVVEQEGHSKIELLTQNEGCYLLLLKVNNWEYTQWICYLAEDRLLVSNVIGQNPILIPDTGLDALKKDDLGLPKQSNKKVRRKIADSFFQKVLSGGRDGLSGGIPAGPINEIISWYEISCEKKKEL